LALFAREENPFAAQVFRMYDAGFLNAASIGFLPRKWERNETQEGDNPDPWGGVGVVHPPGPGQRGRPGQRPGGIHEGGQVRRDDSGRSTPRG
jgi:hypothetical protein